MASTGTWTCERGHRHQAWVLECPHGVDTVTPGAVYRHHRGSFYVVLMLAQDANADTLYELRTAQRDGAKWPYEHIPVGERAVVVYSCLEDGSVWVRTLEDFTAVIGEDPVQRRFERVR